MHSKRHSFVRYLVAGAIALSALCGGTASATFITSSGDPALTGATILDFNAESTTSFTSRTIGGAVTISTTNGSLNFSSANCTNFGTTGSCLQTNAVIPSMQATFNFVNPVFAYGFAINALDQNWTLSTFSPSNVLLETDIIPLQLPAGSNQRRGFAGAALNTQIGSFTITGQFDFALIDDLHFVTQAPPNNDLPEPGTLALLGLGLAGLGAARRRRARRPA